MTRSRKGKVLLVDDSEVVLMAQKMMFRHLGDFEVLVARDGKEAVEVARREHPDLILLDVVMPEMGGFEACRAIRADEGTRAIPIIMVTTRGEVENVTEGYEAGCNDYVTKPIDKNELAEKMRDLLGS